MHTSRPSMDSSDGAREVFEICRSRGEGNSRLGVHARPTCILSSHELGRRSVRKLKLRGAIGVRRKLSIVGCMMGPPAESEYAVLPVGVARISPSA